MKVTLIDRHLMRLTEISANAPTHYFCKDGEITFIVVLIKNKNQAFSREMIIERIWGYDYFGDTRQVDHLIKRLRKKMLLADSECKIETLWGFGYKVSD